MNRSVKLILTTGLILTFSFIGCSRTVSPETAGAKPACQPGRFAEDGVCRETAVKKAEEPALTKKCNCPLRKGHKDL